MMGKLCLTKLLVAEIGLCADNTSAIANWGLTRRLPGESLTPTQVVPGSPGHLLHLLFHFIHQKQSGYILAISCSYPGHIPARE